MKKDLYMSTIFYALVLYCAVYYFITWDSKYVMYTLLCMIVGTTCKILYNQEKGGNKK